MCDVEKFSKIYKDISMLQSEDTLQLVLEAETEEEKEAVDVFSAGKKDFRIF